MSLPPTMSGSPVPHLMLLDPPNPPIDSARRALRALREHRIRDASHQLELIPAGPVLHQAWRSYLLARVHLELGEFDQAKTRARSAASGALTLRAADSSSAALVRLAAAALELQGTALRRQDEPQRACCVHLAAYGLRKEHGTATEQAESAFGVGICAEFLVELARAEVWYRRALEGPISNSDQANLHASVQIRIAALFTELSRHKEAVDAARRAWEVLAAHRPGECDTVRARLHLTHALLRSAESALHSDPRPASELLDESDALLAQAKEELSGFGAAAAFDMRWCREQIEFSGLFRQTAYFDNAKEA